METRVGVWQSSARGRHGCDGSSGFRTRRSRGKLWVMTTEDCEYVLGTDDGELQRLGFQHRVWSAPAFALWERAGVHAGASVLDVGCGPGYGSMDLARLVGEHGRVLGVDLSERFLEHLRAEARRRGLP